MDGRFLLDTNVVIALLADEDPVKRRLAALAFQYGLVLATRDHHFDAVEGLSIEEW